MTKKIILFSSILFIILLGLFIYYKHEIDTDRFENQPLYTIKVGESVDFYVGVNSCCPYCFLNEKTLTAVKLTEEKEVRPSPKDCEGCWSWTAYVFKGVKPGRDTIQIFNVEPGDGCFLDSIKQKQQFSIIEVIE